MVAICALVTEVVVSERNAAFERARIEAANLSAGFEEQVRGTLNGVAGAMEFLKKHIEEKGAAFDLAAWKSRVPELVSPIVNILFLDAAGNPRAMSMEHDPTPASASDRDYFIAHRDNPNLGLFIGQPILGRFSKRILIPASRRLETRDGQFAGVLAFGVDPGLMTALHQKVHLRKTASIDLLRADGITLAHYTPSKGLDASQIGLKESGVMPLTAAKLAGSGEYSRRSPVDGVMRLHHWRRVAGYPLIVAVGLGEAEALAATNQQAIFVICLGMVALTLLLIKMLMLNRESDRRVQHAIALENESEKVRQANAELSLARRRAEEANRAKSAFLANMSHELRTPLNAILGFSEVIRDKVLGNDADRHVHYAADIHQSGAHLLSIVNDILDVAKIEAGKFELREEQIALDKILQGSLVAVEQQASAGSVHLTSATSDLGVFILGDKTKLKQIVINLLSNAIKFTPPGGSVEIAAATDEDGDLSLTIRDTGIGMSGEEIRHAFKLFCQVDNCRSRRFEGTGLGLPLAVQLTELHGGTLRIESTPGSGTTVIVNFPAERVTREKGRTPSERRPRLQFPSRSHV